MLVMACSRQAEPPPLEIGERQFVGSISCAECHEAPFNDWTGSHHELAMQVASDDTVHGDFGDVEFEYFGTTARFYLREGDYFVSAPDEHGVQTEYRVGYTFGEVPLQQYLVEFPDGRLQTLPYCWDTRPAAEGGQRWFHIYDDHEILPGDPLYWTGPQQNWNYMCAECHSTNLDMAYNLETDTFATTYSEINVGCEGCHGPGSAHIEIVRAEIQDAGSGLVVDLHDRRDAAWVMNPETGIAERTPPHSVQQLQPEACGRCHSRRGVVTPSYEYGKPLADTHRLAILDEGLYHADGQILDEVYVYGSFVQSRMYQAGVTCTDCHNPHTGRLHAGDDPNDTCSTCHLAEKFSTRTHTGHEIGQVACVDCHMPTETYMVVDDRRDHSFRIPRPDLTPVTGAPHACADCHGDRDSAWAAAAVRDWHGDRAAERPHYGQVIAKGRAGFANPELMELALDQSYPGIVRATAVSLLSTPLDSNSLGSIETALEDTDPLVRAAALRHLALLPQELRIRSGGAARLADPARAVRIEAALTYAGLVDLLPVTEARAYSAAARDYRDAFLAIANRSEAHVGLGDFEAANGDAQAALRHYEKALEIDPTAVVARGNLADIYRALDQDARGEDVLRDGLEIAPDSAALRHSLGLLLARTGRPDEALAELALAAEYSDSPRFLYVYGVALNSVGQPDEAIRVLRDARASHPTEFDIAWGLATMLRDRGDREAALEIAEELAGRHPENRNVAGFRDSLRNPQ